ncbi:MAG: hypothetical protein DRO15_02800 [Thermoprotei archaeon]|nr:MAG: hypothetical protein DRO15_02800 [Thermoprotei archaeon]
MCPFKKVEKEEKQKELLKGIKEHIIKYVSKRFPGYMIMLNELVISKYGMSAIDALLEAPSKLYAVMLEYYEGDEESAKLALRYTFLRPLAAYLGNPLLEGALAELIAKGLDEKFKKIILEHIEKD